MFINRLSDKIGLMTYVSSPTITYRPPQYRAARTLVFTPLRIASLDSDRSGTQRRFGMFLRALHRISGAIKLVHILSEEQIRSAGDPDTLNRTQSEFWEVPVEVAMIARHTRQETTWNHYGAGVLDVEAQPSFFAFGGDAVAQAVEQHLDEDPDLVFVHRLPSMIPFLRSGRRPPLMVFDNDDIEHKLRFRTAFSAPRHLGKPVGLLQVPSLMVLERRAVAASQLSFVCSELDRTYLRRLGFSDKVRVVPNAITLPSTPPGLVQDQTVLFLGAATYGPNHLAAERMARDIWPAVRRRVPGARLMIAGSGSERLPSAGAGLPGVEHLGFVDDLDALYARSRVVCCPIMVGGGTRVKLVEAAAYARPMVSTRIGAEGLDFTDGQEILLRDDDVGFADACADLLQDDAACRRLGEAGRAKMVGLYDSQVVEDQVVQMIGEAAAQWSPVASDQPLAAAGAFGGHAAEAG